MDELTISHELTIFRDYRSETPGPSAAQTEAARVRLLDAIVAQRHAAPRLRSSGRWAWLGHFGRTRVWAPVAAAAAVTAIAITVTLVAAPSSGPVPKPKPSPAATHQPTRPRHQKSHQGQRASNASARRGQPGRGATTGAAGSGGSGGPPTPTTTALTASSETVFTAHQVTLTATVTDLAGDNLSGGSVGFWLFPQPAPGTVAPGTAVPVCQSARLIYNTTAGDNVATCDFTPTDAYAGSYVVGAGYGGYRQYELSDSAKVPLTISALATATALSPASPAQASPGQTVTLTVVVTDQAGDNLSAGTVIIYWSGSPVLSVSPVPKLPVCHGPPTFDPAMLDNVVTCQVTIPSAMAAGTIEMQAEYQDVNGLYPASFSSNVPFTVQS